MVEKMYEQIFLENIEPPVTRAAKTPARKTTRKSSVASETPSKTPAAKRTVKKAKSFAEVKVQPLL